MDIDILDVLLAEVKPIFALCDGWVGYYWIKKLENYTYYQFLFVEW